MARFLFFFLLGSLFLSGCPSTQIRTSQKGNQGFQLRQEGDCLRFLDSRTGFHFCAPKGSSLAILSPKKKKQLPFDVQLSTPKWRMSILVRKDKLPVDLAEGALSGPWLQRYVESYIQGRGTRLAQSKKKILHPRYTRFLKADAGVWASFPLASLREWEEILVLSRKPSTRYVISIRLPQVERRKHRDALKQFFIRFLRNLRLSTNL